MTVQDHETRQLAEPLAGAERRSPGKMAGGTMIACTSPLWAVYVSSSGQTTYARVWAFNPSGQPLVLLGNALGVATARKGFSKFTTDYPR